MKGLEYSRYGNYIELPYTTGSDYSGDAVTRSNFSALKKELRNYKGIYELYGYFGTYGIGYIPQELTKNGRAKIAEIIDKLESYPCIDEESESKLEWELIEEQFKSDYKYELRKYENEDGDTAQTIADHAWSVITERIGDIAIVETGCIAYINWNRVRKEIDSCAEILKIMETIA